MSKSQGKLEALKQLKKAYLKQMFPRNGESVPQMRFTGFGEEWERKMLGDVARVLNGDRGVNYPSGSDFIDSGVPFINAGHIQNGAVVFDNMDYISAKHYNKLSGAKLQIDDILFCLRGSLGKYALYKLNVGAPASSLAVVRCGKKLSTMYLFQLLSSEIVKQQVLVDNNGSSQPNLSAQSLKNFKIPLPTLPEQTAIGNFFRTLDALIKLHS